MIGRSWFPALVFPVIAFGNGPMRAIDTSFQTLEYRYDRLTGKSNIHDNQVFISGAYLDGLLEANTACRTEMSRDAECTATLNGDGRTATGIRREGDAFILASGTRQAHEVDSINLTRIQGDSRKDEGWRSALIAPGMAALAFLAEAAALPWTGKYDWNRPLVASGAIILTQSIYAQITYRESVGKLTIRIRFQ